MIQNETDNYRAFDLVASALEELELYEASVKAHQAKEKKDLRLTDSAIGEDFAARTGQSALDNARTYLDAAVNEPKEAPSEDQETAKRDKKTAGDREYFKAYYLKAMTDYFGGQSDDAEELFAHILEPTQGIATNTFHAARKVRETADKAFFEEVRYNLGAAQFEAQNFPAAIKNFELVIDQSEKDSLLQLSARLGWALARVKASSATRAEAEKEIRRIRRVLLKDAIFLFRIGWRAGLIIKKRKIDPQTAESFRFVLARAQEELKRKESQTIAPAG